MPAKPRKKNRSPKPPKVADAYAYEGASVKKWKQGKKRFADCQKSGQEILRAALDFMKSDGRKLLSVRPDGRSASYEENEGGTQQTVDARFLCFPGPFDPRAPWVNRTKNR